MRRPSGDQFGDRSPVELSVSLVIFDPSASITYISESPSRSELNATRRPSGDQFGLASHAELSVSLVTFDPSVSITYISESPSR